MAQPSLDNLAQMGLSAPSNQLKAKSWREMDGWGIEALPSSTVGDSAAETPPRARFRNGRTPARFELRRSKKQYVRRVQNSTFQELPLLHENVLREILGTIDAKKHDPPKSARPSKKCSSMVCYDLYYLDMISDIDMY